MFEKSIILSFLKSTAKWLFYTSLFYVGVRFDKAELEAADSVSVFLAYLIWPLLLGLFFVGITLLIRVSERKPK
jgi:hypothetical protein